MLIEKELHTKFSTNDPSQLYSPNINDFILDTLRQRFTGKNYKSCLIKNVIRIIKRSNMVAMHTRQNATYICNVNIFLYVCFGVKEISYHFSFFSLELL